MAEDDNAIKVYTSVIDEDKSGPGSKLVADVSVPAPKENNETMSDQYDCDMAINMLKWIKEYAGAAQLGPNSIHLKMDRYETTWKKMDRLSLSKAISRVCRAAEKIFKNESRCLKVACPCTILGDIHGNLNDLLFHEKTLWPKGPFSFDASCLFLGDYVDRGNYSLECTMYLLSMKILSPHRWLLLRGNHEIKSLNMAYTFHTECLNKFGEEIGDKVFDACNYTFDFMPLCDVVDGSIFCSHGGIPSSTHSIDQLNQIPCPLPDPETMSAAAWEMLWSDPVDDEEFAETANAIREQARSATYKKLIKTGILPNTKRGTTFMYSEAAVNNFLKANRLSLIIRGHELVESGFNQHMNGKVITVFSSSKYSGNNEAAAILVEDQVIRIIKLVTSD